MIGGGDSIEGVAEEMTMVDDWGLEKAILEVVASDSDAFHW